MKSGEVKNINDLEVKYPENHLIRGFDASDRYAFYRIDTLRSARLEQHTLLIYKNKINTSQKSKCNSPLYIKEFDDVLRFPHHTITINNDNFVQFVTPTHIAIVRHYNSENWNSALHDPHMRICNLDSKEEWVLNLPNFVRVFPQRYNHVRQSHCTQDVADLNNRCEMVVWCHYAAFDSLRASITCNIDYHYQRLNITREENPNFPEPSHGFMEVRVVVNSESQRSLQLGKFITFESSGIFDANPYFKRPDPNCFFRYDNQVFAVITNIKNWDQEIHHFSIDGSGKMTWLTKSATVDVIRKPGFKLFPSPDRSRVAITTFDFDSRPNQRDAISLWISQLQSVNATTNSATTAVVPDTAGVPEWKTEFVPVPQIDFPDKRICHWVSWNEFILTGVKKNIPVRGFTETATGKEYLCRTSDVSNVAIACRITDGKISIDVNFMKKLGIFPFQQYVFREDGFAMRIHDTTQACLNKEDLSVSIQRVSEVADAADTKDIFSDQNGLWSQLPNPLQAIVKDYLSPSIQYSACRMFVIPRYTVAKITADDVEPKRKSCAIL
jgi:hypothetical protein